MSEFGCDLPGYLTGDDERLENSVREWLERYLDMRPVVVDVQFSPPLVTLEFRACSPDWKKLREISDRAESLSEKGDLTPELYRELVAEAEAACNSHTEFLESLTHYAPPGVVVD